MGRREIAVVCDLPETGPNRVTTANALGHVATDLPLRWWTTSELATADDAALTNAGGFFMAPGDYAVPEAALRAIRFARERQVPLIGTCGGFQHVVLEHVRNVLGVRDADHEETNPDADTLAVTQLACSLVGEDHAVSLVDGSAVAGYYGSAKIVEPFFCNYGLNEQFREPIEEAGLRVSGVGQQGEVRVVEHGEHPFFLGTLYVPQARSRPDEPHPLVAAFVDAALS